MRWVYCQHCNLSWYWWCTLLVTSPYTMWKDLSRNFTIISGWNSIYIGGTFSSNGYCCHLVPPDKPRLEHYQLKGEICPPNQGTSSLVILSHTSMEITGQKNWSPDHQDVKIFCWCHGNQVAGVCAKYYDINFIDIFNWSKMKVPSSLNLKW